MDTGGCASVSICVGCDEIPRVSRTSSRRQAVTSQPGEYCSQKCYFIVFLIMARNAVLLFIAEIVNLLFNE